MFQSKVFKLIQLLTESELNDFHKFLAIEQFNTNKKIISIVEYVIKNYKYIHSNEDKFAIKIIFNLLYPGETYKDEKIRKQLSLLNDSLEKYLSFITFENDKMIIGKGFLKFLRNKQQYKLYEKSFQELKKKIEKDNILGVSLLYNQYDLFNEYAKRFDNNVIGEDYLEVFSKTKAQFNQYCFTSLLSFQINSIEYASHFNKDIQALIQQLSHLINYLEQSNQIELSNELFQLYYSIAKLIVANDTAMGKVEALIEQSKKSYHLIENREIRRVLLFLANLKNREAMNSSQVETYFSKCNDIFLIHNFLTAKQLLLNENKLVHPGLFLSICLNACTLKKIKWIEEFIRQYKNYLHPDVQENMLLYVEGILENAHQQFEKSIHKLAQVKIDSLNMYINIKTVMLMNHYELKHIEEFFNLISSFSNYMNRNNTKLADFHIQFIDHILKVFKMLFELKLDKLFKNEAEVIQQLQLISKEANNLGNIGLRLWVEDKLRELQ